jgi:hypothetical protein
LSGTDYDIDNDNNINHVFELFYKYKDSKCETEFYYWLKNNETIKLPEKNAINDINDMFCKVNNKCEFIVKNYKQNNDFKKVFKIKKILEDDGFIYPI